MLIDLNKSDQLLREQVFQDVIELQEILADSDDLNKDRQRMREIASTLEYLLLDEG